MQYDYNLSRIYELVINSNPCYAFLLEGNTLAQNKMVIAHVLAHCDFFKNNSYFRRTSRNMVETMTCNAQRIAEYEHKYGRQEVEIFLDAALAILEHVDPWEHLSIREPDEEQEVTTEYDDLFALDKPKKDNHAASRKPKRFPKHPTKDLVKFIAEHSPALEDWQRDVLYMLREEMLYFWPQIETKIINEGWATFWHLRIMRNLDLTEDESLEFAKMHANLTLPSRTSINPYHLGHAIFEDIYRRWDNPSLEEQKKYGRKTGKGLEKIFQVREMENDVSFLRNYLTKELVEELDLYLYQKVGHEWRVVEKDWEKVRDGLVENLINGGFPYLEVVDGDYNGSGELLIAHRYEGKELDIVYLEKTLPYVYLLWGRPVYLSTVVEAKEVLFSYDGKKNNRQLL
ncbi:MAG: SpoVR family protein [Thermoanaerobacteraceae bacterium]|nr:SpoVR family protein [Thermoanaerobacteraceae bacterium]